MVLNEVTTTMHSFELSVNNDYIGNDDTLDEKKVKEKVAEAVARYEIK